MMVRERATRSVKAAAAMPFTVLVAAVVGYSVAPGGGADQLYALYDGLYPVVEMTGQLVSQEDGAAIVTATGTKKRACTYITLHAYARRNDVLHGINATRVDRPADGHTNPVGKASIGYWRVWPLHDSDAVVLAVKYSCGGRLVVSRIADIPLKGKA